MRYLKSELEHFGTTVGDNRQAVRAFARANPDLTHAQLIALVRSLWAREVFECRLAAALLLDTYAELLGARDLGLLQRLVRTSHTWALVDVLAGDVLGRLIVRHPNAAARLDSWAADPDFWVRRAAPLSSLYPLKAGLGIDRFLRYADEMLEERVFFIRKAIGWVLREAGKRDPDLVYDWLAPRVQRTSGVTMREAVKYLREPQRRALLSAYRERTP